MTNANNNNNYIFNVDTLSMESNDSYYIVDLIGRDSYYDKNIDYVSHVDDTETLSNSSNKSDIPFDEDMVKINIDTPTTPKGSYLDYLDSPTGGSLNTTTPERIFNLLDTTHTGNINKNDLLERVVKLLKDTNIKLKIKPEMLVESMFLNNTKGYIALSDFKNIFYNIILPCGSGSDVHLRSSISQGNTQMKGDDVHLRSSISQGNTQMKGDDVTDNEVKRWAKNKKNTLFQIGFFLFLNFGFFLYQFYYYKVILSSTFGLSFARGFGQLVLLNSAMLFVGKTEIFSSLRKSKYTCLDFGFGSTWHILSASVMLTSSIGHTISHGLRSRWHFNHSSLPIWTGYLLWFILFIMCILSNSYIRKNYYHIFSILHRVFGPFFIIIMVMHGFRRLSPLWFCQFIAIICYMIDQYYRTLPKVNIEAANNVGDSLILKIRKPDIGHFNDFLPGAYMKLNVPAISRHEWHPFTIVSSPRDECIVLNIAKSGDWTTKLIEIIKTNNNSNLCSLPMVKVDGPFAAPTQKYLHYDVVVMISGGIGVTPLTSVLRETMNELRDAQCRDCHAINPNNSHYHQNRKQKLHLYWTTKTQDSLSLVQDGMDDMISLDMTHSVELHKYLTSSAIKDEDNKDLLKFFQILYHQVTDGYDIISGIKSVLRTHFGRPKWNDIFADLTEQYENQRVGVFFCGAKGFGDEIKRLCKKSSRNTRGVQFDFFCENF